jgi:hypothetical protein
MTMMTVMTMMACLKQRNVTPWCIALWLMTS